MGPSESSSYAGLPGADLVSKGLLDLAQGTISAEALLVLAAGTRLRRSGVDVPSCPSAPRPYEHRLYELLENTHGAAAFSRYNALLRRLVSFLHALEREKASSPARPRWTTTT